MSSDFLKKKCNIIKSAVFSSVLLISSIYVDWKVETGCILHFIIEINSFEGKKEH